MKKSKNELNKVLYDKIIKYIRRLGTPSLNYVSDHFKLDLKTADKYIKAIQKDKKYEEEMMVMGEKFKNKVVVFSKKIVDDVGYKFISENIDIQKLLKKHKVPKKYHKFLTGMLQKMEGVYKIISSKKSIKFNNVK